MRAREGIDADARAVRIGGLDPKYAGVSVDGMRMASASSATFGGTTRQFEFEQASITSVESIELNKTLTASMDADAPAGSLNLRSRNAFDRKGREVTVAVMGERALGVLEIRPKSGFYSYEAKYTDGITEHLIPAPVPSDVYEQAKQWALMAHEALGCSGLSRADLRWDDKQPGTTGLVMLELNTQPGMTPLSLAPEQAKWAGITWPQLMTWMVEHARRPA